MTLSCPKWYNRRRLPKEYQLSSTEISSLPTSTPAESLAISPEALEVANCFLQTQDIGKTAAELDISLDLVSQMLNRREVKAYVDHVFASMGFNNKFKVRDLIDTIIQKKLQQMDEADVGSTKDITEILALSHKITMEQQAHELAIEKLRSAQQIRTQVNIQQNNVDQGTTTRYSSLIQQLLQPDFVDV